MSRCGGGMTAEALLTTRCHRRVFRAISRTETSNFTSFRWAGQYEVALGIPWCSSRQLITLRSGATCGRAGLFFLRSCGADRPSSSLAVQFALGQSMKFPNFRLTRQITSGANYRQRPPPDRQFTLARLAVLSLMTRELTPRGTRSTTFNP